MKILYVADISSPIALSWIRYFVRRGDEVEVLTAARGFDYNLPGMRVHHLALSSSFFVQFSASHLSYAQRNGRKIGRVRQIASNALRSLNQQLGARSIWQSYISPLEMGKNWRRVQTVADAFQPDIVHALRIPTEGYCAAHIERFPVVLSVWGNDFTLHAGKSFLSGRLTRSAVTRANGLHTDCLRDVRLAHAYGYPTDGATLLIPTAGGIVPRPVAPALVARLRQQWGLGENVPIVINPRGARAYVPLEPFSQAMRLILNKAPETVFVCVGLNGHPLVTNIVKRLGIEQSVRLLPYVSQEELAALFRLSTVMVSPTTHDGTPNTLLECMAQGTFPIASDLESIREWIVPGKNGFLIEALDAQSIADATVCALEDETLRIKARELNREMIHDKAGYEMCMGQAREFYLRVISQQAYSRNHVG